jgi:hypothetical protein
MLKCFLNTGLFLIVILISSEGWAAPYEIGKVPPAVAFPPLGPSAPLGPPIQVPSQPNFDTTSPAAPDTGSGSAGTAAARGGYSGPALAPNPNGGSPSGGSGGGGTGAPIVRTVVIGVCLYDGDYNDGCWQHSFKDASWQLTKILLKMVTEHVIGDLLTVQFPEAIPVKDQLNFIKTMELNAVDAVAAKLRYDVHAITPFYWRDQDTRQINQWQAQADSRAATGSSWNHDWQSNTYTNRLGNAFAQARTIDLHRQWKNQ